MNHFIVQYYLGLQEEFVGLNQRGLLPTNLHEQYLASCSF